ncbi:MAG: T9SS type A sorting domain-containing protein [Candidatus Eisenbacteria bacterium]|nr:T9SS type A sorting domain-containing protein [Candidatus Eisenbacteria bacterium]
MIVLAGLFPWLTPREAVAQPRFDDSLSFIGQTTPGPEYPIVALVPLANALLAAGNSNPEASGQPTLFSWDGATRTPVPDAPNRVIGCVPLGNAALVFGDWPQWGRALREWDGARWRPSPLEDPRVRSLLSGGTRPFALCDDERGEILCRWNGREWEEIWPPDENEGYISYRADTCGNAARVTVAWAGDSTRVHFYRAGAEPWPDLLLDRPVSASAWHGCSFYFVSENPDLADSTEVTARSDQGTRVLSPRFPGRFESVISTASGLLAVLRDFRGWETGPQVWLAEGDRFEVRSNIDNGYASRRVLCTAEWSGVTYWGGSFTGINESGAWNLVGWIDDRPAALWSGDAISAEVENLVPYGRGCVAIGPFLHAGEMAAGGVALLEGGNVTPFPAIDRFSPLAAKEYRGTLVVAGESGDGADTENTFLWTENGWEVLGKSLQYGEVTDLEIYNDELVAVGPFLRSGGDFVRGAAAWNGIEWRGLGVGLRGLPLAAEVFDGDLLVAGAVSRAGHAEVKGVAAWDGFDWRPLGQLQRYPDHDAAGRVDGLAKFGSLLLAVGDFARAGDEISRGIALWDGVAWRRFAQGQEDGIQPLRIDHVAVSRGQIWASGYFRVGRELESDCFCRWQDDEWRLISPGGRVLSLLSTADGRLWVSVDIGSSLTPTGNRPDLLTLAPEDAPRLIDRPSILSIDALGPIPARGSLDVRYSLTRNTPLRYGLYNVGGRRIVEIDGGVQAAGPHAIHIDAESLSLPLILSGVYFLRIEAGDDAVSRRIVVVR